LALGFGLKPSKIALAIFTQIGNLKSQSGSLWVQRPEISGAPGG
jgi:hypothetical protein